MRLGHGCVVEGSVDKDGLQPHYVIDCNHPKLAPLLLEAREIGKTDLPFWEKIGIFLLPWFSANHGDGCVVFPLKNQSPARWGVRLVIEPTSLAISQFLLHFGASDFNQGAWR